MKTSLDCKEVRSDSLVANLSREVNLIRERCKKIIFSISSCHNRELKQRLISELVYLENRRKELLETANSMRSGNLYDYLSLEYLIEISSRPIPPINSN